MRILAVASLTPYDGMLCCRQCFRDYLVKFDADLSLRDDYSNDVFPNSWVGTSGGQCVRSYTARSRARQVSGDRAGMQSIILNLHGVGSIPDSISAEEREWWLSRDQFERILDVIQGHDHVRLTFDDGNVSDLTIVASELLRRGMKASFFICGCRLDRQCYLSRTQVRELRKCGMEIGSHGMNHISWRQLPASGLRDELSNSRQIIECAAECPVLSAACPFGGYDRAVLRELRRAGYAVVHTSDGGWARESSWLKGRTTIKRSTPLPLIENLVQCGPGVLQQSLITARMLFKRLRLRTPFPARRMVAISAVHQMP